jgi:CyaY protein
MMTESEFDRRVDDILLRIEEAIDASGSDIDYENSGGVLTLHFENGSQIIVNRQTALRQIWVAAKSGGHHFSYDSSGDSWQRQGDGLELFKALAEFAGAQSGEPLALE